jgi:pilus assembly protein Flp/PilA
MPMSALSFGPRVLAKFPDFDKILSTRRVAKKLDHEVAIAPHANSILTPRADIGDVGQQQSLSGEMLNQDRRRTSAKPYNTERITPMFNLAKAWLQMKQDTRGVTALEYGLIAAVMGALIVTAFTTLGTSMESAFTGIGSVLTSKASGM